MKTLVYQNAVGGSNDVAGWVLLRGCEGGGGAYYSVMMFIGGFVVGHCRAVADDFGNLVGVSK